MAMQMQSLLVNPASAYTKGSKLTCTTLPIGFNPRMSKHVNIGRKCMAMGSPNGEPTPTPKVQTKVNTSFRDLFAFSGQAPERINGRLAMLGFVSAIVVELSKGTDLFSQISEGGATWFLGTSILLTAASLVPMIKGVRTETKTEGLFNSNTELWNGRLAMLGLVALAFTEFVTGGALV